MTKFRWIHRVEIGAALWLAAAQALVFAQQSTRAQAPSQLESISEALQELTRRVAPSVVQIEVSRYAVERSGDYATSAVVLGNEQSVGSGVIVHSDGYILTNAHVVAGARRIRVNMLQPAQTGEGEVELDSVLNRTLAQATVRLKEATLVGMLEEFDVALIKVSGHDYPVMKFADHRNLRQGQLVFAFGSRDGLEHSVSMGVVSSIARQPEPDSPFVYIQTDAAINPGDSGGPLVNTAGEIVGINTFILSKSGGSEGLGFAIPSTLVEHVANQLREYGHIHRPLIGIGVQAVTPVLASALGISRSSGVMISDVRADSPAHDAGLKLNDLILAVDERPIYNVPMFAMAMLQSSVEHPIQLHILRGGRTASVLVAAKPSEHGADRISDLIDPQSGRIPRLGIVGIAIDNRVAALLPPLRNESGVYVAGYADAGGGAALGLQVGDVIHEINGSIALSVESLNQRLNALPRQAPIALLIERNGQLLYEAFEAE